MAFATDIGGNKEPNAEMVTAKMSNLEGVNQNKKFPDIFPDSREFNCHSFGAKKTSMWSEF
jgi:hypothetical protein